MITKINLQALMAALSLSALLFSGLSYHGITPIYFFIFLYFSINFSLKFKLTLRDISLLTLISLYGIYGFLNLKDNAYMLDREFIYGPFRSILAGFQLILTLYYCRSVIFLYKESEVYKSLFQTYYLRITGLTLFIMTFLYLFFSEFSHTENGSFQALTHESGVAALTLFPFLLLSLIKKRIFFATLAFVAIALTGSTAAIAIGSYIVIAQLFRKNLFFIVLFFAATLSCMLIFSPEHLSKIDLLFDPREGDTGGRYASNLAHISGILDSPYFGTGIESLDIHRARLFNSNSLPFDHGGSDLLRILQDFGIFFGIFFIFIVRTFLGFNFFNFYCAIPIIILLILKGVGIYSISALIPTIFTLFFLTPPIKRD